MKTFVDSYYTNAVKKYITNDYKNNWREILDCQKKMHQFKIKKLAHMFKEYPINLN